MYAISYARNNTEGAYYCTLLQFLAQLIETRVHSQIVNQYEWTIAGAIKREMHNMHYSHIQHTLLLVHIKAMSSTLLIDAFIIADFFLVQPK